MSYEEVKNAHLRKFGVADPENYDVAEDGTVTRRAAQAQAVAEEPSTLADAAKSALYNLPRNVLGFSGGAGGAALATAAGIPSGPGAIAAGVAGALAGGAAGSAAGEGLQNALYPQSWIDAEMARRARSPIATYVGGDVLPSLALMRPSGAVLAQAGRGVKSLAGQLGSGSVRVLPEEVAALANVGLGAGLGGGIEAGRQMYEGEFRPGRLAAETLLGAVSTEPTRLGRLLSGGVFQPTPLARNYPADLRAAVTGEAYVPPPAEPVAPNPLATLGQELGNRLDIVGVGRPPRVKIEDFPELAKPSLPAKKPKIEAVGNPFFQEAEQAAPARNIYDRPGATEQDLGLDPKLPRQFIDVFRDFAAERYGADVRPVEQIDMGGGKLARGAAFPRAAADQPAQIQIDPARAARETLPHEAIHTMEDTIARFGKDNDKALWMQLRNTVGKEFADANPKYVEEYGYDAAVTEGLAQRVGARFVEYLRGKEPGLVRKFVTAFRVGRGTASPAESVDYAAHKLLRAAGTEGRETNVGDVAAKAGATLGIGERPEEKKASYTYEKPAAEDVKPAEPAPAKASSYLYEKPVKAPAVEPAPAVKPQPEGVSNAVQEQKAGEGVLGEKRPEVGLPKVEAGGEAQARPREEVSGGVSQPESPYVLRNRPEPGFDYSRSTDQPSKPKEPVPGSVRRGSQRAMRGISPEDVMPGNDLARPEARTYEGGSIPGNRRVGEANRAAAAESPEDLEMRRTEARLAGEERPKFQPADTEPIFSTEAEKEFRKAVPFNSLQPGKDGTFATRNVLDVLRTKLSPTENEMVYEAVAKKIAGSERVSRDEVIAAIKDAVPDLEVKELYADSPTNELETKAAALRHELDTRFPGGPTEENLRNPEYVRLHDQYAAADLEVSRSRQRRANVDNDSATRRYTQVNPRELKDMPGAVDLLVKINNRLTPEETARFTELKRYKDSLKNEEYDEYERLVRKRNRDPILPASATHYDKSGDNALVHLRAYEHTMPDGEKVLRVFEVQSDWGQTNRYMRENLEVRPIKEGFARYGLYNKKVGQFFSPDRAVARFDTYNGQAVYNDKAYAEAALKNHIETSAPSHPLLPHSQRLALKAAIEHARKRGIKKIVVDDAETAMLTEGHDAVAATAKRLSPEQVLKFLNGREGVARQDYGSDWRDGKYVDFRGVAYRIDKPESNHPAQVAMARELQPYGMGETDRYVPQEGGMRLAYDKSLQKMMRELSGAEGVKVEMGTHKNAVQKKMEEGRFATEQEARAWLGSDVGKVYPEHFRDGNVSTDWLGYKEPNRPRPDLIFKDPSGQPKTTSTGFAYDVSAPQARRATGEPFTTTRPKYQAAEDESVSPDVMRMLRETADEHGLKMAEFLDGKYQDILDSSFNGEFPGVLKSTLGGYVRQLLSEPPTSFSHSPFKVGEKTFNGRIYGDYDKMIAYAKETGQKVELSDEARANYLSNIDSVRNVLEALKYDKTKLDHTLALYKVMMERAVNNVDEINRINRNMHLAGAKYQPADDTMTFGPEAMRDGKPAEKEPLSQRVRGFFAGEAEKLRRRGGPFAYAADKIEQIHHNARSMAADYYTPFETEVLKLDDGERRALLTALYRADETGKDLRSTLKADLIPAYDAYRKMMERSREDQLRAKQRNVEGELPGKDPTYFGHVVSREMLQILHRKPGSADYNKARQEFVDYNTNRYVQRKGLSRDVARKLAETHFNKYVKQLTIDRGVEEAFSFGAVQLPAGSKLPPSWLEPDLLDATRRYMNRFAKDRAFYDAIRRDERASAALGLENYYDENGNAVPVNDTIAREFEPVKGAQEVSHLLSGYIGAGKRTDDSFFPAVGRFINALILAGPSTRAVDWLTTPFKAASFVEPQHIPGLIKAVTFGIPEGLRSGVRTGLIKRNDMIVAREILGAGEEFASKLDTATENIVKYTGTELLERYSRASAQAAGEYIAKIHRALASGGSAKSKSFLSKFGPDAEKVSVEELGTRIAQLFQGRYDMTNLPKWAMDSQVAPFLSMMRWNIEQWNNFRKFVYAPAKEGNLTPLMMTLVSSVLGGLSIEALREQIMRKKSENASITELLNAPDETEAVKEAFAKVAAAMQNTAMLGMVGEIGMNALDALRGNSPRGFRFPTYEVAADVLGRGASAADAIMDGEDVTKVLLQYGKDVTTQHIQMARYAERMMAEFGISEGAADKLKEMNARRDVRMFSKLSDLPRSQSPVKFSPYRKLSEREFDKAKTVEEAKAVLPGLKARAVEKAGGDRKRLEEEMRTIRTIGGRVGPSPSANPDRFRKYVEYLRKTQGPAAAEEYRSEAMKDERLRKAKARLVR